MRRGRNGERRGERERDWGNYWKEGSNGREITAVQQVRVFMSCPQHSPSSLRPCSFCPSFAQYSSAPYAALAVYNVCMYISKKLPPFEGPPVVRDGQLLRSISHDTVADLPHKEKGTPYVFTA